MSIFSYPRIHVKGLLSINVGTGNNDDYSSMAVLGPEYGAYAGLPLRQSDSVQVQPERFGMTDEEWVAWAQKRRPFRKPPAAAPLAQDTVRKGESLHSAADAEDGIVEFVPGEWNYYGDMGLDMIDVRVLSVVPAPGKVVTDPAAAPVIGADLSFRNRPGETGRSTGMLVDVNAEDVPCSQVLAGSLLLQKEGKALLQGVPGKAVTRFINFQRNIGLNGPNGAGALFQCVVPTTEFPDGALPTSFPRTGPGGAPLVGVVFRYYLFRAIQEINAFRYGQEEWFDRIEALYEKKGTNPDYAQLVGTLAPAYEGEVVSSPVGRYLVPTGRTIPVPPGSISNGPAFSLAPAILVVDWEAGVVSIDCSGTFPDALQGKEYDPMRTDNNPKWDFGPVTLDITTFGVTFSLGAIPYADTDGGDRVGWIFDFPIDSLPPEVVEALKDGGSFQLTSPQYGGLLAETEYLIVSDQSNLYAEERPNGTANRFVNDSGVPEPATVRVFRRGVEVGVGGCPPISVWEYDTTPNNDTGPRQQHTVGFYPGAPLAIYVTEPGNRLYTFTFAGDPPPPESYGDLSLMTAPMINVRILPNEDYSRYYRPGTEPPVGNDELTWDVLYDAVLRNYYLLYPGMNLRVPLNDPGYWTDPQMAALLLQRTQEAWWPRPEYMPRTRDLSESRRTLLQAWARRVLTGDPPPTG